MSEKRLKMKLEDRLNKNCQVLAIVETKSLAREQSSYTYKIKTVMVACEDLCKLKPNQMLSWDTDPPPDKEYLKMTSS